MRSKLRETKNRGFSIVIPELWCEHLDYYPGLQLYAVVRKKDLILCKVDRTDRTKQPFVMDVTLTQYSASKDLKFWIPKEISLLLNYYKDQEVELQLKGQRLFVFKLWGE